MAKFRSWNEKIKKFIYFEDGYEFSDVQGNLKYFNHFNWQDAQRFLFTDKFGQDIYVGSTLEGTILGSKVTIIIEEDNFGIAHVRCIECKSTENSESFNLNNVDILLCYNLKVLEDKLMEEE